MSEIAKMQDLDKLKAAFLESLVLRNLSALTIRQIGQYLRVFLGYAKGRGITEVGKVDREVFEQYKGYLSTGYLTRKGEALKSNTVQARLLHVKKWFAWMRKKGALFFDPIAEVRVPRTVKLLPKGILRTDEMRKLMELPDLGTILGYRDRTMMEVLYSTGVRAAELTSLRVPDMDLKKKVARVRNGKGGKDRFVPLSTPCCRFLDRYIKEMRPKLAQCLRPSGRDWTKKAGTGEDFVFLSLYGGPLSKVWLGAVMKRYLHQAGITRPVSPVHSFRHSVATHLLADGMDVRYVQVLLGHSSINSTQIYTHVERETLQRLIKEHHPRALARDVVQPFMDQEEEAHATA